VDLLSSVNAVANDVIQKEYLFSDPFVDKGEMSLVEKLTDAEFRQWLETVLNFDNAFVLGVVPPREGVVKCEEFSKS